MASLREGAYPKIFRILKQEKPSPEHPPGLYSTIDVAATRVAAMLLFPFVPEGRGRRHKKATRSLGSEVFWFELQTLVQLEDAKLLQPLVVDHASKVNNHTPLPGSWPALHRDLDHLLRAVLQLKRRNEGTPSQSSVIRSTDEASRRGVKGAQPRHTPADTEERNDAAVAGARDGRSPCSH